MILLHACDMSITTLRNINFQWEFNLYLKTTWNSLWNNSRNNKKKRPDDEKKNSPYYNYERFWLQ